MKPYAIALAVTAFAASVIVASPALAAFVWAQADEIKRSSLE